MQQRYSIPCRSLMTFLEIDLASGAGTLVPLFERNLDQADLALSGVVVEQFCSGGPQVYTLW